MKLIKLILVIILFATPCYAEDMQLASVLSGVLSGGGAVCNPTTDYVGDKTTHSGGNTDVTSDQISVYSYQAQETICSSGSIGYPYLAHQSTSTETAKLCFWTDSTSGTGDPNNESVIGCSTIISCTADGSGVPNCTNSHYVGGTIIKGQWVFVGIIGGSAGFHVYRDTTAGNTARVKTVAGSYANPPSVLSSGGWSDTASRQRSTFATIVPPSWTDSWDVYMNFEFGANNDVPTVATLTSGTIGGQGAWTISPTPLTSVTITTASQQNLYSPVQMAGVTYTDSSSTRGVSVDASVANEYMRYTWLDTTSTTTTVGISITPPDTLGDTTHYDALAAIGNILGNDFADIMVENGQMYLETQTNSNGNPDTGAKYTYTPGVQLDCLLTFVTGGPHTLAIYLHSTGQLVTGSPMTKTGTGSSNPNHFTFGRHSDWLVGEPSRIFMFDNVRIKYLTGGSITFP